MLRFAPLLMLVACSGTVGGSSDDTTDAAPPENAAVARAREWVAVKLPYCQAPNHAHDDDADCSSTCTRPDNPEWDAYRSDCSGLVSWAWQLPAPGRVTATFAPFDTEASAVIQAADLAPGDAVNNDHHMMLFVDWNADRTEATFIEEPGCSSDTPYAHEFTAPVSIDGDTVVVTHHGTFTAIREGAP